MKIAAIQTNPKHKDIEHNVAAMIAAIRSTEAELLVFPELALTGYLFTTKEETRPYALSVDSDVVGQIANACKEARKSVVFGHLELSGEDLFNSAVVIGATGEVIGVYRKTHLFHFERFVFAPGDSGFRVFDLQTSDGPVKVGVMICYDWRFPESARSLALQGAEIIAIPSNIVTRTGMLHSVLQTRAFENKAIVAFADRVGSESGSYDNKPVGLLYRGESCIINYDGEILSRLDDTNEASSIAEVAPNETRSKSFSNLNDIFKDRRSDMY
jgi:5-aminopentanamidase